MTASPGECVPPLSGTLLVPGLAAPVAIHRDAWGVPHIRARGTGDAWFALGFVHAQDRLFQMDLTRRRATGRAAEFLGEAAFGQDALARRLGVERASRRDEAAANAETRAMLAAYAAGVNGFLDSGAPLAFEYRLLDAVPERWEAWHSIAVMRRLGLLLGSVWFKLWRAAALPVVGAEQVAKLRHDDGGQDRLIIPPGVEAVRWTATLAELGPSIAALLAAAAPDAAAGGSNNWAIAGAHTATGRPLLAGDPHRVFEVPNMYAQHHVMCDAGSAGGGDAGSAGGGDAGSAGGGFDAIGLTVPGVPGFPHFGHNGRVAWCVTHAFMDLFDLFVERFDQGAERYLFRGEWRDVARRRETIAIRGGAPREIDVLETHHGPVIAGDPALGTALTLRTVQTAETDHSFDCLPRMLRAETVGALYAGTRGWGLIDHNLVAADTAGSIGQLVRATLPKRPRANGWLPVPGWTGEHEWDGWIAFEDMPRVIDPPGGVIVTANNRVVADDGPDYLCTDCHPPYRANRIATLIAAGGSRTPEAAAAIHGDTLSPHAALLRARLAALPTPTKPGPADAAAAALRATLLDWDGDMGAGSVAATGYVALRRALTAVLAERSGLAALAAHPYLSVAPGIAPGNQLWWCLPKLLRDDDCGMLDGWNWAQALQAALERAALERAAAGPAQAWGEAHRPRFAHPLSALFPQHAALLDPPSRPVGGDGDTVRAIGLLPASGTAATYGALARYAFDVGHWDASLWCVFHGASGHPGSPHYADQNAAWSACRMVPMRYGWDGLAATQTLVPGDPT